MLLDAAGSEYQNSTAQFTPLPKRLRESVAFNVVRRSGEWVRKHGVTLQNVNSQKLQEFFGIAEADEGGLIQDFWATLDPLFSELLSSNLRGAWCAAGLKVGLDVTSTAVPATSPGPDGFRFHYFGRPDVRWNFNQSTITEERPAWRVASLIGEISTRCHTPPFETLLTTDLCVNVLRDSLPLVITRTPPTDTRHTQGKARIVDVSCLYDRIKERLDRFESILRDLAFGSDSSARPGYFGQMDRELDTVLNLTRLADIGITSTLENDSIFSTLQEALMRGKRPGLALAKYITFMTVIWPEWTRICMLPYIGPASAQSQPGGLVICEDNPYEQCLSADELEATADIASVAMWPWLALRAQEQARAAERRENVHLQTPLDRLNVISNDYTRHETFLQRGVALVDTNDLEEVESWSSFRREPFEKAKRAAYNHIINSSGREISIIIPVKGGTDSFLEVMKSIERQVFVRKKPRSVQVVIVQDGTDGGNDPISEELFKLLLDFPRGLEITLIKLRENRGRSTARNVGLYHASREIVLFVDASMVLDEHFILDQMLRHERLTGVALLGFKENISLPEFREQREKIYSGMRRPNFRRDLKWTHRLKPEEADFEFGGRQYRAGDTLNYMHVMNGFRGWNGVQQVGHRTLPTFFQTNIVSVDAYYVRSVGGFDSRFEAMWGFEDSFLGALLLASDVTLIPCPSSTAFKIEHSEDRTKFFDVEENRKLFWELLMKSVMTDYSLNRFNQKILELKRQKLIEIVRAPRAPRAPRLKKRK